MPATSRGHISPAQPRQLTPARAFAPRTLFCRVKDDTRIVLRKDKTSRSYAGFVSLAFTLINIQLCP
jgi:hypothetical protein